MNRNTAAWIAAYQEMGALWIHNGNPKRPHALLTSGKHSSGFFNSGLVTANPRLLDLASEDLVEKFLIRLGEIALPACVKRVVGPAMGAITLAHDIARHLSCLTAFTEKTVATGEKAMVLSRAKLEPGEPILPVEDVLTTGGSVELTVQAVEKAGGVVAPFVLVLVNRSGLTHVGEREIIALIDKPMPMWDPSECPLCRAGSEAIKPKDAGNWSRLNADYPVGEVVS